MTVASTTHHPETDDKQDYSINKIRTQMTCC